MHKYFRIVFFGVLMSFVPLWGQNFGEELCSENAISLKKLDNGITCLMSKNPFSEGKISVQLALQLKSKWETNREKIVALLAEKIFLDTLQERANMNNFTTKVEIHPSLFMALYTMNIRAVGNEFFEETLATLSTSLEEALQFSDQDLQDKWNDLSYLFEDEEEIFYLLRNMNLENGSQVAKQEMQELARLISPIDIQQFFIQYFRPEQMILCIMGSFPNNTANCLEDYFSSLENQDPLNQSKSLDSLNLEVSIQDRSEDLEEALIANLILKILSDRLIADKLPIGKNNCSRSSFKIPTLEVEDTLEKMTVSFESLRYFGASNKEFLTAKEQVEEPLPEGRYKKMLKNLDYPAFKSKLSEYFREKKRNLKLAFPSLFSKEIGVFYFHELKGSLEHMGIASYLENDELVISSIHASSLAYNVIPRQIYAVSNTQEERNLFFLLPISAKEGEMIAKIILTMSKKNGIELLLKKKELEKLGDKIHHVHPMRFLGHILANHDLRHALNNVKKSYFKWTNFIDGFGRRMSEERIRNNLDQYVPGFCAYTGANKDTVQYHLRQGDWEGLIRALL